MARSHLRSVESDPSDPANSRNAQGSSNCSAAAPPDSPRWVPVALALALVVTLALLVWSRLQMGDQISSMQGQIADLAAQVAERDDLILAQDPAPVGWLEVAGPAETGFAPHLFSRVVPPCPSLRLVAALCGGPGFRLHREPGGLVETH